MARRIRKVLTVLVAVVALAGAAFFLAGPERVWSLFGPADLGPVDFATLQRRATPNDALACAPGLCAAKADIAAPVVALSPPDTFVRVRNALAREPRLQLVAQDEAAGTLRYVQRSALMQFPDTIDIKVVPGAEGGSAVLLYSRSQLGRGDLGVNLARLERCISLFTEQAQK